MKRGQFWILLVSMPIYVSCSSFSANQEKESRLKPCPESPNCVNSLDQGKKSEIEPIKIKTEDTHVLKSTLIDIIGEMDGIILEEDLFYIKAEFKSTFFGFKDLAEFQIDLEKMKIDMASRALTGWYDFKVNRDRMEKIRRAMEERI